MDEAGWTEQQVNVILRRRQALRRDAVFRLPPPARHVHQSGAHLQHLRPAPSLQWPFGVPLHRPGPAQRAHYPLRRRLLDARSRSELIHKPQPTDDPKQRQPDIRLTLEAMAWEPTIAYFDALLKSMNL